MSPDQLTFEDGLKAGHDGQASAASHLSGGEVSAVRSFISHLANDPTRDTFTTDDVHAMAGDGLADRMSAFPNALGGIVRAMLREGVIERTGVFVRSSRPEARGRHIPCLRRRRSEPL